MRYLVLLLAAAGGLFSCERVDAASVKAFQAGSWEGAAYYRDDTGALSICSARTQDENGTSLSLALRSGGSWALLLVSPEGFPSPTLQYTLYTDGKLLHSGPGTAESGGKLLRIDIPYSEETIRSLGRGTTLRVSSSRGDAAFSLKGSADAIAKLQLCANAARKTGIGAGESDRAAGPRPVARNELLPYAQKILENAGFSNFRFLPQDEDGASNALVWRFEDGALGSLSAAEKAGSIDLDRSINQILASDVESCKGEFAHGQRAQRYENGAEVRTVFASCNFGPRSFHAEHIFVRMPDGFLVQLTALKKGAAAMAGGEGQDASHSRDAAARTEAAAIALLAKR